MAHATSFVSRRGSNALSGGSGTSASLNCNSIPMDDHQPSLLIHAAAQSHQSAGAQMKKKSGFQITSVLPAQVSASTNNSIADDTESYDDIDESHTEDLSYSDILDLSVSRATDTGMPERSSSEETLNSLHGGETPGVVSPNEAVNPHQAGCMVNGTVLRKHQTREDFEDQGAASASIPQPAQGVPALSASINGGAPSEDATAVQFAAPAQSRSKASIQDVDVTGTANDTLISAPEANSCGTKESGDNTMTGTQPLPASTQVQASTASASRFRVVKLDSTDPFRKGRWMCTEYFEKEAPTAAPSADAYRAVDGSVHSECESTSEGPVTSGPGEKRTQQAFVQPAAFQTIPSQDTRIPTSAFPPVAPTDSVTDCEPAPSRIQDQLPYIVEGQLQSGYAVNPPSSMLNTQGLQSADYAQIPAVVQAHEMPTGQSTVTPKATSGSVPQSVSTRPHMLLAEENLRSQVQQMPPEQQPQTVVNQPPQPKTSTTGQTAPSTTFLQSNILSIIPPALSHGGLELTFHQQEGPSAQLSLARGAYSGVKPLVASRLEDAGRLLLQHQSLFSLPQLAAGGVSGLSGQFISEGSASGDASAFVTSTGTDEDSFSGASAVAIDNKIEQAMDLVKSHLMYAVREEVEVLKEQIKELIERNSQLEQENHLLKNLASLEQLAQFQAQVQSSSPTSQTENVGGLPTSQPPGWGPPV